MKIYIKYILISILTISSLTSCKKAFLDQSPEATIPGTNFFKTETDIKQAVNGAYSSLIGMGLTSYWLFGEMRSDNTTFQYNGKDRGLEQREFVDQFLSSATAPPIQTFWQESYTAIARCNDVLDNVGKIAMADAKKNQYTGEAELLRGFHYFNLVRQFGGVPLRITGVQSPADARSKGRASEADVYKQIIADLTDAAAKLPAKYTGNDIGRVTQGTALTLLGKAYLTQKNYADALTALRKVTTLGYAMLPDYKNVFDPANKNSTESIFEIQYLGSQNGLSSNFLYQFAPWTSGSTITGDPGTNLGNGNGYNIPTQDMIDSYEPGDTRKDASLSLTFTDPTSGKVVPYVVKYNHGFVDRGKTNDDFPILRYPDVLLMIAECLNEQGFAGGGEAFNLLNQVRTRAHLPAKTSGNPVAALNVNSQAAFRDAIFQERRIEFAFENHRWYDLLRTGKAVDVMNAHGVRQMAEFNTIPAGSYRVTTNKLLLPIPQREVTLDNLTQNPQ